VSLGRAKATKMRFSGKRVNLCMWGHVGVSGPSWKSVRPAKGESHSLAATYCLFDFDKKCESAKEPAGVQTRKGHKKETSLENGQFLHLGTSGGAWAKLEASSTSEGSKRHSSAVTSLSLVATSANELPSMACQHAK
jgi:hypothetical protein